jgi:putative holliday junction resolvase
MSCILALDVGTKTIGVARARGAMAFPVTTLRRKSVRSDTEQLYQLCRKNKATEVVVGLPYELDGAEGRSARLARQIGVALGARTGLPIHYQDERYSTVEASRRLTEQGLNSRQQRSVIDQAAAAVILQDWLDAQAAPA